MNPPTSLTEPDSHEILARPAPAADAGPFGMLPRLTHRQLGLQQRLERLTPGPLPPPLDWLRNDIGVPVVIDRPDVLWRAAGLNRAGVVAHITAPRLATRLAIGIETPLAHTVVDRLLGFDRSFAENRLQLTPVEWGIWTFLFLRALDSFDRAGSAESRASTVAAPELEPGEFTLDRVGPDSFDPSDLGSIVTVRWPVRIGTVTAAVRLWLPESVVSLWLAAPSPPLSGRARSTDRPANDDPATERFRCLPRDKLSSSWRAVAGVVTMSQGLRRLRTGGALPFADSRLTGTPASPSGLVDLILDLRGQDTRFRIPGRPVADSGGRLVRLEAAPLREPRPSNPTVVRESETKLMTGPDASTSSSSASSALDMPVTLTVELGRVNMTLTQLADLKPGDVIELNRHSRAPVELTSNGRPIARGELILIDTDLGVRVTSVFL